MKVSSVTSLAAVVSLCAAMAVSGPVYAADAAKPAAGTAAATDMQILAEKIKADKKLVVAANMVLTDEEAKGFWPIYDAYQKDLGAINKRIADAVSSYAKVYKDNAAPDDLSKKLISDTLEIETAETQLRKTYAEKLSKVLPARKTVRYLQIESKIRALVRYELAAQIPLLN